jgi:hypothetical protein
MGNPNSPAVNSQVTNVGVKRNDSSTVLTVQVVGFADGKSVEVYGYVTQPSGAFASFRETQDIPKADPATGASDLTVTVPAEKLQLEAGQPVTVLTWVSEFWPSMLTAVATSETGEIQTAWAIDQAATDRWRSYPAAAGG